MRNKSDRNPNFLTKFFWFCSGANTKVLRQVESEHGKYANQGFAIFIIGIVGSATGGYAISTVVTSRFAIYLGGALWGLILSSIDRSMISGFNKKPNPSFKEQVGAVVSLIVKLGISTLISFTVAKPLELKIFESSIEARIAKNTEEEIGAYSQPINAEYQREIEKLEGEKEQHRQGLTKFQQQLEQSENAYQQELIQGGFGRGKGYGSVARQLEQSVDKAQQQYDRQEKTFRPLIEKKEAEIASLKAERSEKIAEIEREVKEEQTGTDFAARLRVLHQIQEEEAKIFWVFGVYGATGWVISLIFVLIDTYPVINKIFSPIDNYERLLEKNQQAENTKTELVLEKEYELQTEEFERNIELDRETGAARANNERELMPVRLAGEKEIQQQKAEVENTLISQGIADFQSFSQSYLAKSKVIGLENLEDADDLAQLRKVKKDFDRTYRHVLSNFPSRLEEKLKIKFVTHNKSNQSYSRSRAKSNRHASDPYTHQEQEESEPAKKASKVSLVSKALGLILAPVALWVAAETVVVARIKIDPIPYPQEASPHLVYTADGREIRDPKSWKTSSRELELADFSTTLQQALIASEDRRFYQHNGFDFKGTARALLRTVSGNQQGGSTITQQVAKKLFIEQQQPDLPVLRKKLQQIILASRLERNYDKEEILQIYLNRIYLGHQKGGALIGFEEAAQFYFGKSARELNISESATLVGMLPSPNTADPINNLKLARKMRDIRIEQMLDLDIITQEEAAQALDSELEIKTQSRSYPETLAPYAYDRAIAELAVVVGKDLAQSGQFIVETTLNSDYQKSAEQTLNTELQAQGAAKGYNEGALVTIDRQTGAILALVGGKGANYPVNYASEVKLSLASTFKLIPYTVAIAEGFFSSDKLSCDPWQGQDGYTIPACHQGDRNLTLAESLAESENPPVLRLAEKVGLEPIEDLSTDLGLGLNLEDVKDGKGYHQQLVLGTYGSTVLNITNAYAAIANRGILNQPHIIETVRDRHNCIDPKQLDSCKIVYSASSRPQGKPVVDSQVAQEVTTMLRGVIVDGTATQAINNHYPELITDYQTVGKTGTSLGNKDLWFVATVPEKNITTGVWLGQSCIDEPIRQQFCPSTRGDNSFSVAWWAKYMKQVLH